MPSPLQDARVTADSTMEKLKEGDVKDSTESPLRYAGYGSRIKTTLLAASRYTAYTSDVGESFRPVAHPYLVRGGYAVSWLYILSDVGYETYRARINPRPGQEHEDWREVMVKRATFQTLASMALPAFTIHSIVRYSARAMKNLENKILRRWGPIGLGLGAVPALPYLFDEPVEKAVDFVADRLEKVWKS